LVTFGVAIIVQNGLLQGFGADTRTLPGGGLETATIHVGPGFYVGVLPLVTLLAAVALVAVLDLFLYRSRLGARIRAASDDVAAAELIGLSTPRISALAMAVAGATAAVAACFMGMRMNFDPTSGPSQLLIAFEAVVLGGLGSLWGTLAGGVVLGVAQSVGGEFDAAWQAIAGHAAFLLIFLLRPQGFFPKH
jgi:branched-chain amino acid transport system permease protein